MAFVFFCVGIYIIMCRIFRKGGFAILLAILKIGAFIDG